VTSSINLGGVDDILANIKRLGTRINDVAPKALKDSAEVIRRQASINCPRDNSSANLRKKYAAGQHLADNIIISDVEGTGFRQRVLVGPQKGDHDDFYYGKFLEFGTSKMAAKPFVEPAFLAKRRESREIIADAIREALRNG
jgi:HK97 gp10 family phage protein